METANWQVPNIQMLLGGQTVTLHEALLNKRGLIFGVPGAFTPVCSQKHVPGFRDSLPYLREAVEYVACVAVNDPYVLKAWAKDMGISRDIMMIADWEGKFTKALGLELDASGFHMGVRCRRFCILVANGTILWFGLENDAFADKAAIIMHHLGMMTESGLRAVQQVCRRIEAEPTHPPAKGEDEEDDEEDETASDDRSAYWNQNGKNTDENDMSPVEEEEGSEEDEEDEEDLGEDSEPHPGQTYYVEPRKGLIQSQQMTHVKENSL